MGRTREGVFFVLGGCIAVPAGGMIRSQAASVFAQSI